MQKYAIVRASPERDDYLRRLLQRVSPSRVLSGTGGARGARPSAGFGPASWKTGSGCIAPHAATALLHAIKTARDDAHRLHDAFMPLDTLRDALSSMAVLHDAVTFSGIADTGPWLPLLSSTPAEHHAKIDAVTRALLAFEHSLAGRRATV